MAAGRRDAERDGLPSAGGRHGALRVGPVLAIPAVLADLGVAPERVFRLAGVDLQLFQDPENRVPLESIGRLFEVCVALTGCRHFGLLVGERFDLNAFGAIGDLMRHSATVGDALRDLLLHLHLHDRGGAPLLLGPDAGSVVLGYSIYHEQRIPAAAQIHATATTVAYRILRELCGPAFEPLVVRFAYDRPGDAAEYRRLYQSAVAFDAATSGVTFASSWLSHSLQGADPRRHRELAQAIRAAAGTRPISFAERLEGVINQALLGGTASEPDVARRLAIHERTMRRRLRAEGTSFRKLVNETRFELACQLLRNRRLPVTEIAAVLQYADPNAFSRAFRTWSNRSPKDWRARSPARPEHP